MNGAWLGIEILGGGGENSPNRNVFLLRVIVFAPGKHHALAFVSESKMLRIPFAHLITISGFEEDTADSKDAPALLHFSPEASTCHFAQIALPVLLSSRPR